MKIVYVGQDLPVKEQDRETVPNSIFLAGPTPRGDDPPSWRPEAISILGEQGFDGHVFIPEADGGGWLGDYAGQVFWEWSALGRAACVLFWVPRNLDKMPGFTTNIEFGVMAAFAPERIVLGSPADTPKMRYLHKMASDVGTLHQQFNRVSYIGAPLQGGSLKSCLILAMTVAQPDG